MQSVVEFWNNVCSDGGMIASIVDPDLLHVFGWFLGFIALFALLSMVELRHSEERLRQDKDKLENQIVARVGDLLAVRSAAAARQLEMQQQFDAFRASTSAQLTEAQQRAATLQQQLDDTLKQSWRRQAELQASLDEATQMCGDAPAYKTRVAELEKALVAMAPALRPPPPVKKVSPPMPVPPAASEKKVAALETALKFALLKSRRQPSSMRKARPFVSRVQRRFQTPQAG